MIFWTKGLFMAGKTKTKKKRPLDTRSKMYLVLAL